MKIAISHLRHAQVGGTERFLNQISSELAERGHEVTILCRTRGESNHPDIRFVQLRAMAFGRGHRLWRFAKDVERHLQNHQYDLVFGLGRTWSQDVVRVGGGLYRDQIAIGRGKRRYWPRDLIAEAIERRTFSPGNYKMVIANSRLTERALSNEYGIPQDQMTTIHNAVDTQKFSDQLRASRGAELRRECGFEPYHNVYLFLGSGYRRKGLDRLLKAFPEVLAKAPASRLMIVGNDSKQHEYEKLAEQEGIAKHCVFLGKRNDPEVCYNAADIYVMPTQFDAFGFSALEALACGLPVIITDTAGAAEVMTSSCGEVLSGTEEQLPHLIGEAMLKIPEGAKDQATRQRNIEVAANYGEQTVMAKNIDVLEQVYANRQRTQ